MCAAHVNDWTYRLTACAFAFLVLMSLLTF